MTHLLLAERVCKRFGGIQALDAVTFDVAAGEVHGLVGENGAGKSTLIKLFAGVYKPSDGHLVLRGSRCSFASPGDALCNGIGVIQQELRVVPAMSVAENIMLGHWPARGALRRIDRAALREGARMALDRLGVHIDIDGAVQALSFAEKQSVAIARALSRDAQILILDEPTAALDAHESEALFAVIAQLKATGVGIVYVSHRLEEVVALSDRCTVMRDGRVVSRLSRGEIDMPTLVRHMSGRDVAVRHEPRASTQRGEEMLVACDDGISLAARDITGLAGLLGSGASEILHRTFGARGAAAVKVRGKAELVETPRAAVRCGLGFVPGERALGLVLDHTVYDNIVMSSLGRFRRGFAFDDAAARKVVSELIAALDIRPADPDRIVRNLSGGNQQKVAIAKWLAARVDVLLMDEPTQGVDIAAKVQIHRLVKRFADDGGAVLFSSTDMQELLSFADSIIAVRDRQVVGRIGSSQGITEADVRSAISGQESRP